MIRNYFLLLIVFVVLFLSGFSENDIKISMIVPEKVKAGESFQIIISIEKGNNQSFSRFQQNLPHGLTAERVSSSNADFSFENQRVRFIWLKLPAEENIQLVYNVQVEDRLKGSFNLYGEFSYIEENERKTLETGNDNEITIIPNPLLADSLLVDIKDYEGFIMSQFQAQNLNQSLMVERKEPSKLNQNEFLVQMKVSKAELDDFGKIEEYIPEGYTATEVDSKNGIFSFTDQIMKIIWFKVPKESEFIISYKLYKKPGNKSTLDPEITGYFSYISANKAQSIEIIEKNYELAILTTGDTVRNLALLRDKEIRQPEYANNMGSDLLLQPEKGVYYRVQLIASKDEIDLETYFGSYTFLMNLKYELHEGLRKYTVGSFSNYKDASDYCNYIWKNTNRKGAFITAYYNGKRVSVQEALKMQNQK